MAMSRSRGAMWLTTFSPMETVPEVIVSSPASMRSAVVLPQPEGPTSMTNSPSATTRLMSDTACVPSEYTLVTPLKVTPATTVTSYLGRPTRPLHFTHHPNKSLINPVPGRTSPQTATLLARTPVCPGGEQDGADGRGT